LRRQFGLVALEHAVADVHDEILLAAGHRRARHGAISTSAVLVGASAHRQRDSQDRGQLQSLEDTHLMFHSGASTLWLLKGLIRSTAGWLSEDFVNLDEALPDTLKCHTSGKTVADG
jgi:hypothetical protein